MIQNTERYHKTHLDKISIRSLLKKYDLGDGTVLKLGFKEIRLKVRKMDLLLIAILILFTSVNYNALQETSRISEEMQINAKKIKESSLENNLQTLEMQQMIESMAHQMNGLIETIEGLELQLKEVQARTFIVTAYDLSVNSTGKPIGHPGYGITRSGYNLSGHSWDSARTIAVDPKVIPLGSKVYVSFDEERHKKYNGVYTARDTGGAIKGNKIDLFLGDFKSNSATSIVWNFGRTSAKVAVIGSI